MPNYKITIQYDGTDFFGWQSQPDGNTVQDNLLKAISQITQEKVNLIGSGRTDSGVHALGQVANFRIPIKLDEYKFLHALNSLLPPTISISNISLTDEEFHSRFDAKKRSYLYLINKKKSPFLDKFSFRYPFANEIQISILKELSSTLLGKHDFTSFCKAKTDTENKVCTINNIAWRDSGNLIYFRIEADRFLHGMVRTIVGTLLSVHHIEKSNSDLLNILEKKNREAAGESVPAKGLFLYKVKY